MLGVLGMFKSYPTLSDPGLFLSMIALFPEIYPCAYSITKRFLPTELDSWPDLRHPFVTGLIHLHASLLMPLFNRLWLSQGTGNANFFYASTLVFGCANGGALIDCVWAGLRIAVGEEKEGYAVIQE
jgi:GPI-anchor transamidase subunit U